MAGYQVTVQDAQLQRRIHAIAEGLADATPLMRMWSDVALASIARNFNEGGRPKWKRLADATIQRKGHDKPLIGRSGNLRKIVGQPEAQAVRIGTQPAARAYAAIHQFGGQAGRGHAVTIPARPYIVLQDADLVEMRESARDYLRRSAQ